MGGCDGGGIPSGLEAFPKTSTGKPHDFNAAVAQADIVVTAPSGGPLFDADGLHSATHIYCVGANTRHSDHPARCR